MTIPAADSDAELIARTRAGDMAAYDELYRKHVTDAAKVARIVTDNSDEAQDVVSEAFTRVLTKLRDGGGPEEELGPYVRTVVRRLAIDRHRSTQRQGHPADPTLLDVLPTADDPMARATDRQLVREAFETLPDNWQQVLWHTEIEGRSPASLAAGLGSSPNAVAALAYRAREGLRQAYLAVNLSNDVRAECKPFAPKIAAYVRGTLPEKQSQAVTAHLDDCQFCRERRDELLLLVSDLRGALWPALLLPAAAGTGAVVAGAGAGAAGGGLLAWLSPARLGTKGARTLGATAGAAAVGIVAAVAISLTGNDVPSTPEAAPPSVSQNEDEPPGDQPDADPPADEPPDQQPPADDPPADEPPADEEPDQPSSSASPTPDEPTAEPSPTQSPTPPPPTPSPTPTASPTPPPPTPSPSPTPTPSPTPPPPPDDPDEPPAVVDDPPPTTVARTGEPLTLTVQISGNPEPTLQWQTRGPSTAPEGTSAAAAGPDATYEADDDTTDDWTDVPGATSASLTFPALDSSYDGRQYRVVAINEFGTVTTEAATLTVQYPPEVGEQPADQDADLGDDITLSASAASNPALSAVRWESRASESEEWRTVSGGEVSGRTAQLTVADVRFRDDGTEYRAVFTNELGTTPTDPATLSVTATATIEIDVFKPMDPRHEVTQCVTYGDGTVILGGCGGAQWRLHGDDTLRWSDGRCLTALSSQSTVWELALRDCSGDAEQRWTVEPLKDGAQAIENGATLHDEAQCLDIRGGAIADRDVIAFHCHYMANQQFRFNRD